ncbi:MAG: hypothetical protein ABSG32_16225 [Terriglobia bacterium]|jgi:hypothetical protein
MSNKGVDAPSEKELRREGWCAADTAPTGLQLLMEKEGAHFFMPNPNGEGTFIRFANGRKRLIRREEFTRWGMYGGRLEEIWISFNSEFERRAKERSRDKKTRLTRDRNKLRLTGCYFAKLPPDFQAEEKREVTLTIEFRPSKAVIDCSCDPAQFWGGRKFQISTEEGRLPILDGEKTLDASHAAIQILEEFCDKLEPCGGSVVV